MNGLGLPYIFVCLWPTKVMCMNLHLRLLGAKEKRRVLLDVLDAYY